MTDVSPRSELAARDEAPSDRAYLVIIPVVTGDPGAAGGSRQAASVTSAAAGTRILLLRFASTLTRRIPTRWRSRHQERS